LIPFTKYAGRRPRRDGLSPLPWRYDINKGRIVTILFSAAIHGVLILFLSFKGKPVRSTGQEDTPVLSLFNYIEESPPPLENSPPKENPPPPETRPSPVEAPPPLEDSAAEEFDEVDVLPESVPEQNEIAVPEKNDAGPGITEGTANTIHIRNDHREQTEQYLRRNYDYIRRRILDRLVYPARARRSGDRGTAEVLFTIREDGTIGDPSIRKTSGSGALDEAALEAVRRAAPFRPPPAPARIAIPVVFTLR
jgi:protein TonB